MNILLKITNILFDITNIWFKITNILFNITNIWFKIANIFFKITNILFKITNICSKLFLFQNSISTLKYFFFIIWLFCKNIFSLTLVVCCFLENINKVINVFWEHYYFSFPSLRISMQYALGRIQVPVQGRIAPSEG